MKRWVTNYVFIKAVPDTKKLYRRPRHRDCIEALRHILCTFIIREKVSFTPSIPKNWHVHANSITDLWYYVLFGASPPLPLGVDVFNGSPLSTYFIFCY